MSTHRIATSRRMVQAALLVGFMLFPFLSINDNPALRMDIGQRTLFLAGSAVRIDQFYLVLLSVLLIVAGFLMLTLLLGRVWCGWLCPQTVLNDLVDLARECLHPFITKRPLKIFTHLFVLLLSMAVSMNILCWFLAPGDVISNLFAFSTHPVTASCFFAIAILLYLNLVLVRRSFCSSYCPYGRFQAALLDEGTLNLSFLEETRNRCICCGACVKVCPLDIDIRQGFQIECINCGRCIDACRGVMERLNGSDGLIAYRFGALTGSAPRVGTKTAILTVMVCVLFTAFAWGLYSRSDTAFSAQRIAVAESRILPDGSRVDPWRVIIGNRGQSEAVFALDLSTLPGANMELLGPVNAIRIAPNENRQVSFFIRSGGLLHLHQPFGLRLFRDGIPVKTIQVIP